MTAYINDEEIYREMISVFSQKEAIQVLLLLNS